MTDMTQTAPPRGQSFEHDLEKSDRTVAAFERKKRGPLGAIQHGLHGNPTLVPVIVLGLSIAAFGLIAGGKFFSAFNLTLIMQQVSIIGILAAAQSLIILTAGIDLSVAAIMVLMSVIAGNLAVYMGVP
ncbi:ribose ABC transporter permease, partial [Thioclava atlantica]